MKLIPATAGLIDVATEVGTVLRLTLTTAHTYTLQAENEEEERLLAAAPFDNPSVFCRPCEPVELRFPAHDCLQEGRPEGRGRSPLTHLPDHPASRVWRDEPHAREGVQVYSCRVCGQVWGRRYQWDAGTGNDDRWWRIEE